jgi:hypothetical protein
MLFESDAYMELEAPIRAVGHYALSNIQHERRLINEVC